MYHIMLRYNASRCTALHQVKSFYLALTCITLHHIATVTHCVDMRLILDKIFTEVATYYRAFRKLWGNSVQD